MKLVVLMYLEDDGPAAPYKSRMLIALLSAASGSPHTSSES